jgi:ABC-type phosphate transport system substrate-binding protein
MFGHASISFSHFVFRGPGRSRSVWTPGVGVPSAAALLLCSALLGAGCTRGSGVPPVEDTETSGRISIAASPDAQLLLAQEVAAFRATYPQAALELRPPESSAQVVGALLGGRADLAAAGRELEDEERNMARQAGIELEGHRVAQDAICLVVPEASPVHNLTVGEVRKIWLGEARRWSAFGGPDAAIVPVLPPLASDLARAFAQRVMDGAEVKAPSEVEVSDSAVAAHVARTPGAIGVVPLALAGAPGVRALAIAPLEGLGYSEPDMEAVHSGRYPLTLFFNLYIRTHGPRLAGGFVTYVASQPGQQLVLESGRVPTAVPLRFVHRSPMLGSH